MASSANTSNRSGKRSSKDYDRISAQTFVRTQKEIEQNLLGEGELLTWMSIIQTIK